MAKYILSNHKIIAIALLSMASNSVSACDICGSGLRDASFSMGYLQTIPSHFLGIWGNSLGFKTQTGFSNGTQFTVSDNILQSGLVFNQQVNKKVQVNYRMGVQQITRFNENNENSLSNYSGLTDLNVALNYTLIDNRKFALEKTKHLALTSIQVKLPNGHYQLRDQFKRLLPINLQPGNGSYGIGAQALYAAFKNNWNWNLQLSMFYNFQNELKYQQGFNQMIRAGLGRSIKIDQHLLIPMMGYQFQRFSPDLLYQEWVTTTGGNIHNSFFQLEWINQNFYGRFQVNIPLRQSLPEFAPRSTTPVLLTVGWLIQQNSEDIKSFD